MRRLISPLWLGRLGVLLFFLLLPPWVLAQGVGAVGVGAVFVVKATRCYQQAPQKGVRLKIPASQAFPLQQMQRRPANQNEGALWYQLAVPQLQEVLPQEAQSQEVPPQRSAEGWLSPLGLEKGGTVRIWDKPPQADENPPQSRHVPREDIEPTDETLRDADSPLLWRRVRYAPKTPHLCWIAAKDGIYRADRSAAELEALHRMLSQNQLPIAERQRLLGGSLRVGDLPTQVRWALGEPLHVSETTEASSRRNTWQYNGFKVFFEDGAVTHLD